MENAVERQVGKAVIRSVYDLPVVVTERRAQVRGERTPRGGLVH
jgi:hypothetical protein